MGRLFLIFLAITLLLGCNQSSNVSTPNRTSITPDFASIQKNVFELNCVQSGCHLGATAENHELDLRSNVSYSLLVNEPSDQVSTLLRVNPGDPNNSYLIQKLEGTAAGGERMPLNAPPLPQSTINTIRQWISDGASNNQSSSKPLASTTFEVVNIWPANQSALEQPPQTIQLKFSQFIDSSYLHSLSVSISSDTMEETALDLQLHEENERIIIATIDVEIMNLTADNYQVTVTQNRENPLRDTTGQELTLANNMQTISEFVIK